MAKVRAAINIRCQEEDKPKILFVERGKSFWAANTGYITDEFSDALDQHGLKTFWGNDASTQPGDLQELMLHATAVGWIRNKQKVTTPKEPWKESVEEFGQRMREIAAYCNEKYDVEGLCHEFPERVQMLVDAKGERIPK